MNDFVNMFAQQMGNGMNTAPQQQMQASANAGSHGNVIQIANLS